ncbi:hypothetical protein [Lihuaxuella thermophila]|uniref:YtkA-like n=1 Tax=Lihuaxuella thermophila TaxID=1173111 RepID=A0A1H8DZX3_9BACL|nr:hypothetical protein [Lihuaxuella thermophila]SEN12730.1 hypothetical protein SAMN05444955_10660 [Lihuaxuella thermophila]
MRVKIVAFLLCMGIGLLSPSGVWSHEGHHHGKVVPLEQAVPDKHLVQVEVPVKGAEGSPVRVKMFAPPANFFPSTDFPVVEGTQLLDGTFRIRDGKISFQYLFPIRGTYRLVIEGMGPKRLMELDIEENPDEMRNAGMLISGLALFGFGCGYFLTKWRRRADEAI